MTMRKCYEVTIMSLGLKLFILDSVNWRNSGWTHFCLGPSPFTIKEPKPEPTFDMELSAQIEVQLFGDWVGQA